MTFVIGGILSGAAYGLLAVGFVLVYRGTRIFNLAHGEVGAAGLYVAWALLPHLPVAAAALIGIGTAAMVGFVMERTVARRLVDRTPLAALAATLGVGLTLAYLEAFVWGFNIKTFPSPVGAAAFELSGAVVTAPRLAALVVAAGVALGLTIFLRRTRFGLEVSATTSDMTLARLSGIRVARTRAFVWTTAGAIAGVAAILIASVQAFHPLSMTLLMVRALAAALLGGLSSISGAFVGGLAIGLAESLVISSTTVAGAADGAIFVLLLAALLLRPQGVLGAKQA